MRVCEGLCFELGSPQHSWEDSILGERMGVLRKNEDNHRNGEGIKLPVGVRALWRNQRRKPVGVQSSEKWESLGGGERREERGKEGGRESTSGRGFWQADGGPRKGKDQSQTLKGLRVPGKGQGKTHESWEPLGR